MKRLCIILVGLMFFVSSCEKDNGLLNQKADSVDGIEMILVPQTAKLFDSKSFRVVNKSETVSNAEEFAKLLAKSLKEKSFRKFLKDEANKKFDGDYDILYSKVKAFKLDTEDFETKIAKQSNIGLNKGKELIALASKNEKLNISIPILIEKWDDKKELPLVAVSLGADEKTTEFLIAYDSNSREYLIDAKKEPNVLVIIVGNNERMGYVYDELPTKNLRTSGNTEKIKYLKCPNLGAIESWYFGIPEIRFDGVVYNNTFSAAFQAFSKLVCPPSRNSASGGYYFTQNLFE